MSNKIRRKIKKKVIILFILCFLTLVIINNVSAAENETEDKNFKVTVKVSYKYNEQINPEFTLKYNDKTIDHTKKSNFAKNIHQFKFKHKEIPKAGILLKISAPGYKTQLKKIKLNSLNKNTFEGTSKITMNPTLSYKLGSEVTKRANKIIKFSKAKKVMVITTAGMAYYQGKTSENALDGIIIQSNNRISFGNGNLFTFSAIRTDPINFAFIYQGRNNKLYSIYFKNGSIRPIFKGRISGLTSKQWKYVQTKFGKEDAYSYVSIAHAWAAGMKTDVLTQASYHGHVCTGLISGQAMIETLMKIYPPRGENGLPLEETAYYVLGVPGGSDDDAFTWGLDITPGKRAYIGIDTMVNKGITGFIRWDSSLKTGKIIIMSYNEKILQKNFFKKTGLNPKLNARNDFFYQKALIKTLNKNPARLINILYEFDGLSEDNLYYLMGEEQGKGDVKQSAHGLDLKYILSLYKKGDLKKSVRENSLIKEKKSLSDKKLEIIGLKASKMAYNYFTSKGINIEKDISNFFVLTSAGYVRIDGKSTEGIYNGINKFFGSQLSRKTLLPVHSAIWKDLVFDFYWVNPKDKTDTLSYSLSYNSEKNKLKVTGSSDDNSSNANYIIQEVLKYDPPYDVLIAWLFHNHVCGGSSPGYLIGDYIFDELPLGKNEKYIYVTTNANCKDDVISRILGVSPGMGNYYNLRYDNTKTNGSNVGIVIRWNEKTQTGKVSIINWKAPKFKSGSNSYEEYIKLYKGDYSSPNLMEKQEVTSPVLNKRITKSDLNKIISGAVDTTEGNALDFISALKYRSLKEVISAELLAELYQNTNMNNTDNRAQYDYNSNFESESRNNIGINNVNAALEIISSESSGSDDSESSDSYEVTKNTATKGMDSNSLIFALIVVLIFGGLLGYGFMRAKN